MKKILEVLQYGDHDIRFNTDMKFKSDQDVINLIGSVSLAMMTTLWGGNELMVLGAIRSLAVADLAVSVNRKEMVQKLDQQSEMIAKILMDTKREMEKRGAKFISFGPGIHPPKAKS